MTSDPLPPHPPAAPTLSVEYGAEPGQTADLWLPAQGPKVRHRPWVLLIHGDFWSTSQDRWQMHPMAAELAARGYAVAAVGYRRVGEAGGGWPGTLDDVARAVRLVPEMARRTLDSDSVPPPEHEKPVLVGYGSGGHLALWAARRAPVRAVLALAPVADLATAYRTGVGAGAVGALLGGGPDDVPERYAAADPGTALPMGVPMTIIHGTADDVVPVDLSRNFAAAARRAGDGVTVRELPGGNHGDLVDPRSAAWPAVLDALTALG